MMASSAKKQKRLCSFKHEFTKTWPCIVKASTSDHARCIVCNVNFSIGHQGKGDIERHLSSQKHKSQATCVASNSSITSFTSAVPLKDAVTEAEIKFTHFLVEHNCPLAAANHAGKLFRSMFLSSSKHSPQEIIQNYACARTKTTAIVKELANQETVSLTALLKSGPYSIATDASNDKSDKLFPIIIIVNFKYFKGKIIHFQFF